jgi:hypothetical protein
MQTAVVADQAIPGPQTAKYAPREEILWAGQSLPTLLLGTFSFALIAELARLSLVFANVVIFLGQW